MTSRPRKRLPGAGPAATVTTYEPAPVLPEEPLPPVAYGYPHDEPVSAILKDFSDEFGMVRVVVLRSHDGLYEGEVLALPNCPRTAGLVEAGFVDVVVEPEVL